MSSRVAKCGFILAELSFCIQRASEQFAVARAQNQAAATREAKLKELAAAYDSFSELKSNLTEGTKVKQSLWQLTIMSIDLNFGTWNVYSFESIIIVGWLVPLMKANSDALIMWSWTHC